MKNKCKYSHTLSSFDSGFMIVIYKAASEILLPDGSKTTTFTAKGYMLPVTKGLEFNLEGDWEKYKRKDGTQTYTFAVTDCEEILPTKQESVIAYLETLDGVGPAIAKRMYDAYGDNIFNIVENDLTSLATVKGISAKKAEQISNSYGKKKYARALFQYLYPYRVKDYQVIKIHKAYGQDAVSRIQENPYCITDVAGVGFSTAERIAQKEGIPADFLPRIEAGIIEVLIQSEVGGQLFQKRTAFPGFVYDRFLREPIFNLLSEDAELNVTGSTYTPRDIAYLMALKLLKIPLTEQEFDRIVISLHRRKRLFVSVHETPDGEEREIRLYRYRTAQAEYRSAKKMVQLMQAILPNYADLAKRVANAERKLTIRLSDEQNHAVCNAIQQPISIITGGPGTGKTAVQKGILSVYTGLYPDKEVLLVAPTGRAAKRMTESTGYPARTLHSALGLFNDNDGELASHDDGSSFTAGLIIVDECSMIGGLLMDKLLEKIMPGTRLVLVGDIDQLPSIEVGAVLREVIDSGVIPVTRLTKTYRQADGSPIAINAARIKKGITNLEYQKDFIFSEQPDSHAIAMTIAGEYKALIDEYGFDDVICLSAYRKSTESGSNMLNEYLRNAVRNDITQTTPSVEKNGQKIYEGDRIMYTRNSEDLANGDIGILTDIKKSSGNGLTLTCVFDGQTVVLEGDELPFIELAYATTVHKSQGSEYKVVIMVSDNAHKIMMRRNLLYTGITRAKAKILIVGQMDAFHTGIATQDSVFRRSQLGVLLGRYAEEAAAEVKKVEKTEQMKLSV